MNFQSGSLHRSSELRGSKKPATVKQTILKSLEAPRLNGVEARDFVMFLNRRQEYVRKVEEKAVENGIERSKAPITSLRNSMERTLIQLFVLTKWVPETSVDTVSEASLLACIQKKAVVKVGDYDFSLIERHLADIRMDNTVSDLESRVWKFSLRYSNMLEQLGYSEFITQRTHIEVEHMMSCINNPSLKKRVLLNYRLKKEEYKTDYGLFLRETAAEAHQIFRSECAMRTLQSIPTNLKPLEVLVEEPLARTEFNAPMISNVNQKDFRASIDDEKQSSSTRSLKRSLPQCLNPDCDGEHLLKDCEKTSEELKNGLFRDLRHGKPRRISAIDKPVESIEK